MRGTAPRTSLRGMYLETQVGCRGTFCLGGPRVPGQEVLQQGLRPACQEGGLEDTAALVVGWTLHRSLPTLGAYEGPHKREGFSSTVII